MESCKNSACNGYLVPINDNLLKCVMCNSISADEDSNISQNKINSVELWDVYKKYYREINEVDLNMEDLELDESKYCKNDDCCAPENNFSDVEGYNICNICGTTQDIIISQEKYWNNYISSTGGMGADKSPCGMPFETFNPYTNNLNTIIPKGIKTKTDVLICISCEKSDPSRFNKKKYMPTLHDKLCPHCGSDDLIKRVKITDLSDIQRRINYNHKEKSYYDVQQTFENLCTFFDKQILNTCLKIWRDIALTDLITRGAVRKGLIACCLHYSCIHNGFPRTSAEICEIFKNRIDKTFDQNDFNKGNKEFRALFENSEVWCRLLTQTLSARDYIPRFCNILTFEDLNYKISNRCIEIYEKYGLNDLSVIPKSAAAGIIYFIVDREFNKKIKLSKAEIENKLDVCNPTLTKAINDIKSKIKYELKKKN